MSERGTFVTSYLYDYPNQVPVLRRLLPQVCRKWGFRELVVEVADSEEKTRGFMGVMHCGYSGEEALEMEFFILDEIVPALPERHGRFSIAVCPESEEFSVVFSILDRKVTKYKVGAGEMLE